MAGGTGVAPDRNLALELVRVTESAALSCARWVGRGDKESADQAAVDAMRAMLDTVAMNGVVVIGEGEKDEAPMLYNGEEVGNGNPPEVDVAVDPLEGTRLTSVGQPNAIAVIAVAERGTMFFPGAAVYMDKIAAGPEVADAICSRARASRRSDSRTRLRSSPSRSAGRCSSREPPSTWTRSRLGPRSPTRSARGHAPHVGRTAERDCGHRRRGARDDVLPGSRRLHGQDRGWARGRRRD